MPPGEQPKRILILTADVGFGHRRAANAVAAALRESRGGRCAIEIVNPLEDERLPAIFRSQQEDYDRFVRELPDLYKFGFRASNAPVPTAIVERVLMVMMFETMRDLLRRHQPEAILITYPGYQAPLAAVFAASRRYVPLLTAVTDLAIVHRMWFHDAADLCLVPTPQVSELARQAGLPAEKIRIVGIPVDPQLAHPPADPAALRARLGWRADLKAVLAVGSKRVKNLKPALRALDHSGLPIQLALVAGGDEELFQHFQSVDWHAPVAIYNFVEDMPALLHAADLVLCKAGGLIVTEALACGRPLLLIDAIPGQETGNARYVVEGGAGEMGLEPLEALEILYHWLERGGRLLAERAENARRLGRPRSAYEVADLLWAAAEHGPYTRSGRDIAGRARLIATLNRHGIHLREKKARAGREGEGEGRDEESKHEHHETARRGA